MADTIDWMGFLQTLSTFCVLIAAVFSTRRWRRFAQHYYTETEEPPLQERVDTAVKSLRAASEAVDELQDEIEARGRLVEDLQSRQKLLELSKEQVEAVARTLQGDLVKEGKRAMWYGIASNAVFFGLGVVVTLLIQ